MARMFSIHLLELRPGVTPGAFEHYMRGAGEKILHIPGGQCYLLKADRGPRTGMYAYLVAFDSTEARDRLWPAAHESSVEGEQYAEAMQEHLAKWATLATVPAEEGSVWGDYVVVLPQTACDDAR